MKIKKYLDTLAEKKKIYVALLHYPMKDKEKENVATSITNMDLHDISRSCTTYDVKKYYVVTPPLKAQREIASRVINTGLRATEQLITLTESRLSEGLTSWMVCWM